MSQPENKPEIIPNNGNIRKLTPKRERFVQEYCTHWNATQAAKDAGFSPDCASEYGYQLLQESSVQQAIAARMAAASGKALVTTEYVINGLKHVAETCNQSIPLVNRKGKPIGVSKLVDSGGASKALELLGKHVGAFEADNAQKDHGVQVLIQQYAGNANDTGQLGTGGQVAVVHSDSPTPCTDAPQGVIEGETVPTDEADDQ